MEHAEKRVRPGRFGAYRSLVPGPDRSDLNHDHADIHQTIRRATEIMEFVWAELQPVKLAAIARGVGLDRSTVLRLLNSLVELGYVHRDDEAKSYAIGFMAQRLGSRRELLRVNVILTDRFIADLAALTGECIAVASLDGISVIYHSVRSCGDAPGFVLPRIGTAYQAHCCAAGLSLLGNQRAAEIRTLYSAATLERPASRTLQSVDELIKRARQSRSLGYALERDEAVDGRAALAVPVVNSRGVANMAVVMLGRSDTFDEARTKWLLGECRRTVEKIYNHVLC